MKKTASTVTVAHRIKNFPVAAGSSDLVPFFGKIDESSFLREGADHVSFRLEDKSSYVVPPRFVVKEVVFEPIYRETLAPNESSICQIYDKKKDEEQPKQQTQNVVNNAMSKMTISKMVNNTSAIKIGFVDSDEFESKYLESKVCGTIEEENLANRKIRDLCNCLANFDLVLVANVPASRANQIMSSITDRMTLVSVNPYKAVVSAPRGKSDYKGEHPKKSVNMVIYREKWVLLHQSTLDLDYGPAIFLMSQGDGGEVFALSSVSLGSNKTHEFLFPRHYINAVSSCTSDRYFAFTEADSKRSSFRETRHFVFGTENEVMAEYGFKQWDKTVPALWSKFGEGTSYTQVNCGGSSMASSWFDLSPITNKVAIVHFK